MPDIVVETFIDLFELKIIMIPFRTLTVAPLTLKVSDNVWARLLRLPGVRSTITERGEVKIENNRLVIKIGHMTHSILQLILEQDHTAKLYFPLMRF
ncbi:unnamed protein product [Caenorhabditis sp. 36 PRJEB53466]|nr:unnamed protein product [Caenorhabditis sp. 36 PRJEB53466]